MSELEALALIISDLYQQVRAGQDQIAALKQEVQRLQQEQSPKEQEAP